MATEAVLSDVSDVQLGNKGLVITVSRDGSILGHLMVGKASIVWFEKHAKRKGRKVSWEDFHRCVMQQPLVDATRP